MSTNNLPALIQFIRGEVGGTFETTDDTVSVGTSSTLVVPHDYERLSLAIVNLGSNDVYVRANGVPSISAGIKLIAGGGVITLTARDDFDLVGADWFAIGASGTNDVYYTASRRFSRE